MYFLHYSLTRKLVYIFACLFGLGLMNDMAYAATKQHVLTNVGQVSTGASGEYNVGATSRTFNLVPHGHNHITYIKYRVREDHGSARLKIYLGHHISSVSGLELTDNGDPEILLKDLDRTSGWRTYEHYFNTSKGRGNRCLLLYTRGRAYESWRWTVEVLEVRYTEYFWDDLKLEITPEKYVKFTATRDEGIGRTKINFINNITGKDEGFTIGVSDNYKVYTLVDTSVQPEKTYDYTFYSDLGKRAGYHSYGYPWTHSWTGSIKVPSDATLAMEAAEKARDAAVTAQDAAIKAAERTWDVPESKSASTLAKEARDKVIDVSGNR